jgi:hypothetical protein
LIDEVLERRRRLRWRILAQYVMYELVRNARMIWAGVLDVAGLLPTHASQGDALDVGVRLVKDTPELTAALRAIVDSDRRARVHAEIAFLAEHSDDVLARWASVMLSADVYARVIDRHVELAGQIAWIAGLLDKTHPPSDTRRQARARSNPAVQIVPEFSADWFADRIVTIAQLAQELDRYTLDLALQIVPVNWWEARLGT